MSNLRETVRKRILVDMIRSVQPTSRWKIVVVDAKSLRILNSACKMADILEENVTLVEDITRKRTSYPSKDAIYFISPLSESVHALVDDFTRAKPMYACAHVFFSAPLPDNLIGKLREIGQFVQTFRELNIDFMPKEEQVFTISHPNTLYNLFHPPTPAIATSELQSIASKIMSVFSTLGELPHIRYHDASGENQPDGIPFRLATILKREFENKCEQEPEFPPKSSFRQPVLILLDRSFDLMSPLVHEFTYQAMMNDLLVMDDGKYVYQAEDNEDAAGTSSTGLSPATAPTSVKAAADPKLTKALLDESDVIWMLIRHWHFVEASAYVIDNFKKFLMENKAAVSYLSGEQKKVDLNEMKDTITSIPQFQEMKAKFSVHINICNECQAIFERRRLDLVASVEQDLATGETADGKTPRNIVVDMTPVLVDTQIPAYDKLRVLMLYIIAQEGIQDLDRKRLLDAAKLSLEDSQAITNLGLLGVRLSSNQEKKKKLNVPRYTYYGRVAEKKKKARKRKEGDVPYDLSRFVPMLKYIIEDQISGNLDTQLFPWINAPPSDENSAKSGSSSAAAAAAAAASAMFTTKSKIPAALQPLPSAGNPYSLRTTRASWAKKPKLNMNEGGGFGGASAGASGKGGEDADDLRKNGPRVVVFIAGGVTFSEIRSGYEIVKELKRDVIIGSTSIINSTQFINVLKTIHSKDEARGIGSSGHLAQDSLGADAVVIPKSMQASAVDLSRKDSTRGVAKEEAAGKEKKGFKLFKKKEKE
ncbi:vacuolar sorting protein VPS33/slp1 [Chytriomyces hyalinus]|nr:vacuolar sorting protein VPS33/slp1 [Chytriomyces hyalinus]